LLQARIIELIDQVFFIVEVGLNRLFQQADIVQLRRLAKGGQNQLEIIITGKKVIGILVLADAFNKGLFFLFDRRGAFDKLGCCRALTLWICWY